ncbi:MAG: hypothetical protein IJ629_03010 [Clostridia bacterium]|nr:hypothetical protein [Clostridia bacterium]
MRYCYFVFQFLFSYGIITINLKIFEKLLIKKYSWNLEIKNRQLIIDKNGIKKIDFENLVDIRTSINSLLKITFEDRYKIIFYLIIYYLENDELKCIELPYSGTMSFIVRTGRYHYDTMPEASKVYFVNPNDIRRLNTWFIRKGKLKEILELDENTYEDIRKGTEKGIENRLEKSKKTYSAFANYMGRRLKQFIQKEDKVLKDVYTYDQNTNFR